MAGLGKKTVEDINVKGKRCIVRCDFNVPVKDGVITDDKRIREALKTVKYLKENGAKIILCSFPVIIILSLLYICHNTFIEYILNEY